MVLLIVGMLTLLAAGPVALLFIARLRLLNSTAQANADLPVADRYRPMLRLLSDADLNFASANPVLRGRIRRQRREMFRGYLRCLAKDYARLLNGIRRLMVESGVDRPDLAKALAANRVKFALALCRIEVLLGLHALGVGRVDVSELVEALEALRTVSAASSARLAAMPV